MRSIPRQLKLIRQMQAATDMANSGFLIIQGRKIEIAEYPTKRDYIMQ